MGFWDYSTTEHALPLRDRASCVKSDVSGSCPSKLFCAPITRCKAGLGAVAKRFSTLHFFNLFLFLPDRFFCLKKG
jgi:hypothetical protein